MNLVQLQYSQQKPHHWLQNQNHITQKKEKKSKQNKNQTHDGLFCLHRAQSSFSFNAHTSTLTPKPVCFVHVCGMSYLLNHFS